ncbi:hypothetical protein M758_UG220700 [Ceratodon purpureus]|nr:hypothetical protein M758_UG220700 [Ceratodon purpureus]
MALIWFLWCQKTSFDIHHEHFHVGVALFRASQLTIQSGMGAWKHLTCHRKGGGKSKKQQAREDAFLLTWGRGNLFCKVEGRPKWQPVPHHLFLPKDICNKYNEFRANLPPTQGASDAGTHSHSPPVASPGPSVDQRLPDVDVEALAQTILDDIIADLHEEARAAPDEEQAQEQAEDPALEALPDTLQSEDDLRQQAAFWVTPNPPATALEGQSRGEGDSTGQPVLSQETTPSQLTYCERTGYFVKRVLDNQPDSDSNQVSVTSADVARFRHTFRTGALRENFPP